MANCKAWLDCKVMTAAHILGLRKLVGPVWKAERVKKPGVPGRKGEKNPGELIMHVYFQRAHRHGECAAVCCQDNGFKS